MFWFRFVCVYFIVQCGLISEGHRILGLFPAPSKSHYSIGKELFKELANRGHEVTLIGPLEEKDLPSNFKSIKLEFALSENEKKIDFFSKTMSNPFLTTVFLQLMGGKMLNFTLQTPEMKKLLNSGEKFDAVVMDQFIMDGFSYVAHHFGANNILVSTTCSCGFVNPLVNNPAPPSSVAELLLGFSSEMNFFERLQNTVFYIFRELTLHFNHLPTQNKILQENIPSSKPLYDFLYNVSLVLVNGHESFCEPVPLVPGVKNVGGLHVSELSKLPDDLQKFMDNAKEGVVYFNLGSNLKSKDMPQTVRDGILRVFSKLKINILWKWESDNLPGQPSNVKLGKWLPQKELLAHPNMKLFITHGGLLSTIEAVYSGVPLLHLPVYGDQKSNAANAARKGFSLYIPFHELNEEKFEAAVKELLSDPKYRRNAMIASKIYHDRPMKPMDEAVYWVEYVIKHGGAKHWRVASLKLAWYQYLLLDVIVFLLGVLLVILYMLKLVVRRIFLRRRSQKIKTKIN